jgi:hypothetical protein
VTSALIVAPFEPSEGICVALVVSATASWVLTTATVTLPEAPVARAVTVMLVPDATPFAVKVASACPFASVTAWVMLTPPALEVKATVTPLMKLLLPSLATAVMVALVVPSEDTWGELVLTVMDATAGLVVPPVLLVEPVSVLPPQALRSTLPIQAMIDNLRMSFIP